LQLLPDGPLYCSLFHCISMKHNIRFSTGNYKTEKQKSFSGPWQVPALQSWKENLNATVSLPSQTPRGFLIFPLEQQLDNTHAMVYIRAVIHNLSGSYLLLIVYAEYQYQFVFHFSGMINGS
jgi:hypothetical protein